MRRTAPVLLTATLLLAVPVGLAAPADAVDSHLTLQSKSTPENLLTEGSRPGGLSNDGRYLVFESRQPGLVAGQTADDGTYAYLRDASTRTTTRLTTGTTGWLYGNLTISGDGRYVVTASVDDNDHPSTQTQLRLYTRATGTWRTIAMSSIRKSVSRDGYTAGISDDGRLVAYDQMTYEPTTNTFSSRSYLYDTVTGATRALLAGVLDSSVQETVYDTDPVLSADGRYVVVVRSTSPGQATSAYQLLRVDTTTGAARVLATSAVTNQPVEAFGQPSISDDGTRVGYSAPVADGTRQAYVYDTATGSAILVSRTPAGAPGADNASAPQLSGDGRVAAYSTASARIVPGTADTVTVYLYDLAAGTSQVMVAPGAPTYPGGPVTYSASPFVDGDGDRVAFASTIPRLTSGSTKGDLMRTYLWRR